MRDDVERYDVFGGPGGYTIRRKYKKGGYRWFWTGSMECSVGTFGGKAKVFWTKKGVQRAIENDGKVTEEKPAFTVEVENEVV